MCHRKFIGKAWLPLLISLAGFCSVSAAADRFDAIRTHIRESMVERSIPSVAVAVAEHGRIIWEEGFGWADKEQRIAATEHTMYSLASITKPLTATGLMTLVQAGKIDLDRPVDAYLGDARLDARVGDAVNATVRRVANHTSGLPTHAQFIYSDESYAKPSRDETILRYGNLVSAPGERFHYSNLGYGILDYLISRVSAQSYADFMRSAVFEPLGLTHTAVNLPANLSRHQAVRYDSTGLPIPAYDFDHPGASAIYSSAHDLVRFGMFHLKDHLADQRRILRDAAIDEMQRPSGVDSDREGYGIGWIVQARPDGYRVISHTGGMAGVSTLLMLVPSADIAIVVLTNSNNNLKLSVADAVSKALLPGWEALPRTVQKRPEKFSPVPDLLGVWQGTLHTYESDLPLTVTFLESGAVHVNLGDQLETLLDGVEFDNGWLHGSMRGELGTQDVNHRRPYALEVSLKLRGKVLNGDAVSWNISGRGNRFSHWVELKKQPPTP